MTIRTYIACLLTSACLLVPTFAQPTTRPAEEKVLPELKFDSIPLPDVVAFLRDVTGNNIVLQSAPGVDPSGITLSLQLKEVTLSQVLTLLTKLPGQEITVESDPSEGRNGGKSIVVINVLNGQGAMGGGGVGPIGTLVLNLSSSFAPGMNADEAKKRAEQITTLISSSLEAANLGAPSPNIFFHPETHILIVRGTAAQRVLLEEISQKLRESAVEANQGAAAEMRSQLDRMAQIIERMQIEIKERQMRTAEVEHERDELVRSVTQLKAELEIARKQPAEAEEKK